VDSERHISTIRLYSAIHVGTRWKIQDRRQIKKTEKIRKLNTILLNILETVRDRGLVPMYHQ